MKRPLVHISYGIPKSGSTLAFELAKAILELNGCAQARLSRAALPAGQEGNVAARLTASRLQAIEDEAAALGYPIVVKTHAGPTDDAIAWLAAGRMLGHGVYRDPREIVLSALEHGGLSRREGRRAFSRIASFEDALGILRKQIPQFLDWVRCPGMMPLYYDEVAFDTPSAVRRLCAQMGMEADPAAVERRAKGSFTQLNKGVRGRFREMPKAESERVLAEFRDFYAAFIDPHGKPPPPPRRSLWERIRRRT